MQGCGGQGEYRKKSLIDSFLGLVANSWQFEFINQILDVLHLLVHSVVVLVYF